MNHQLIEKVIRQIRIDLDNQDVTAIAVLLEGIPNESLEAFLRELDK